MSSEQVERGPNGFPYIDKERSSIAAWENGEYHLKIARSDGELVSVNLREEDIEALEKGLSHTREEAQEDSRIDSVCEDTGGEP